MGYNYNLKSISQGVRQIANSDILIPARVVDVILDSTHPEFEKYGKWAAIGAVKYKPLNKQSLSDTPQDLPIAYPLQSHIKHIPLKDEVVLITVSPSEVLNDSSTGNKNYYLDIVNLWNHPHHNAHPGLNKQPEFGNTFEEAADINPMLPFEGDVIVEGRFGNSLRFGSTNLSKDVVSKENDDIIKSNTYSAKVNFVKGDSNPESITSQLRAIENQVRQLSRANTDVQTQTFVKASESQVTNPEPLQSGDLAKLRLEKTLSILSDFKLISSNTQSRTQIGKTPYTKGVSNVDSPKYLEDQYVTVEVTVTTREKVPPTESRASLNNWSSNSNPGSPITIISNGQISTEEGYSYVIEDVNNDFSSVYLTSTQQIPLLSTQQFNSTFNLGASENYTQSQFLANSDRITLNGRDSIVITSAEKAGIKSNSTYIEGVNELILDSSRINLGVNANHPVLKGDNTINLLTELLDEIIKFGTKCLTAGNSAGPDLAIIDAGSALAIKAGSIKTKLSGLKSTKTFVA